MKNKKRIEEELNKFNYNNSSLKLTLGVLIVAYLCAFLIVIATFTELAVSTSYKLPVEAILHPLRFLAQDNHSAWLFVLGYQYIPQVPVILFIAALLGSRFGVLSVLLYIVAGLSYFPVFALGGGWRYIFEYNFGYILAFVPAVIIAGNILSGSFSFKNVLKAAFFGVLIIHFIGILYTTVVVIFKHDSFELFMDMIAIQSGIKVLFDFVCSIFAIIIARPVKKVLWLAMG